jgi:hypothetical protein
MSVARDSVSEATSGHMHYFTQEKNLSVVICVVDVLLRKTP